VNYNYSRYLGECIESVLAQTYPNMEVIVVDDGSTDDSLSVLQPYRQRVRIIRQRNKGVSAARNAGISAGSGQWIAFLDSDDIWRPEKLQQQSSLLQDPTVGMVFCGVEYIDESGRCLGHSRPDLTGDFFSQLLTFTSPTISGSTALVRSECLHKLGGF